MQPLPLAPKTFVAIDFETANTDPVSACALGVVRVERGKIVSECVFYLNPPTRDFAFTSIHGITLARVRNAPEFGETWPTIEKQLQGAEFLAAHNAIFDRRVLRACCNRWHVPIPNLDFVCSRLLAKKRWHLPKQNLPSVARHLGLELDHHDAGSDARVCAQIVLRATEVEL